MKLMNSHSKMYIFVKKSIKDHKCLAIAHGVLMCHLKFHIPNDGSSYIKASQSNLNYEEWLSNSFRKVVCEVTDNEFDELKLEYNYENGDKDYIIVTESGLNNQEIRIVFCPRKDWPEHFKKYPLMKL